MLKINLLPSYIYQRRKVRQVMALFIVLVLGVGAAMFGWFYMLNNKKQQLTADVATWEAKANHVTDLEAQVAAEEAKAPPIQSKVAFIEGIMSYNEEYPKLYEELARYTYSRILYRSIDPSSTQLKIGARARSVGDCGRYLLNMYRASHLLSSVTIDSVPGWSGSIPQEFDFSITCTLAKPVTAPTYGTAAPGTPGVQ